jgi:hypothetical protein
VHRSQSYPGQAIPQPDGSTVRVHERDDYALVVLDRDLGVATNPKLKGQLGFWGENPSLAVIKVLADAALHGKDARVTGYPGDACGSALIKRSSTPIDKLIANCVARRPDEWASRQWWAVGTMDARNHRRLLYHTADTHEGQSGSPIYLAIGKVCSLAAVHAGNDNSRRNKGERVTARMLTEIAAWINLDPSIATATVQNGTLTVRRAAPAKASEMENGDGREI